MVEAGFEDRVMFGTDQLRVAEADGLRRSSVIQNAELPHAAAEARHPLQQRRAVFKIGWKIGVLPFWVRIRVPWPFRKPLSDLKLSRFAASIRMRGTRSK